VRGREWIPAFVLVMALVAACGHGSHERRDAPRRFEPGPSSAPPAKPNIVLILADDLDTGLVEHMPRLKTFVTEQGMTFSAYFVTDSLCCPSRASILRGQYVHNHRITGNEPPLGGFEKFHALGCEESTVATWLQQAGYRTAMLGKYLNRYPAGVAESYVPPGWDEWASPVDQPAAYRELRYRMNENGRVVSYGKAPADYLTDVLSAKANAFVTDAAKRGVPFFLYLAPYAPHAPATPAPRDKRLFADARLPRMPSFDEADVGDKPEYIRRLPRIGGPRLRALRQHYLKRRRSVQAIDAMVESLIGELGRTGQLERTYVLFTSDNGFHLGEHRLPAGKQTPYDEDIRVPLVVRGPGVPAGRIEASLVSEVDLAPTFAAIGGTSPPDFVDGRSLGPFLMGSSEPPDWRRAVLIEHDAGSGEPFEPAGERRGRPRIPQPPTYRGVRTSQWLYVEYVTGERELYDLRRDPDELDNVYDSAAARLRECLAAQLDALRSCAGDACRAAERRACAGPG
jgi:N-acetylglucosamine-6-sulfatase